MAFAVFLLYASVQRRNSGRTPEGRGLQRQEAVSPAVSGGIGAHSECGVCVVYEPVVVFAPDARSRASPCPPWQAPCV